ncbi:hypothetical protein C8J57DRAFT_433245 [Mycena rebaudengoi]|nr:hypothetical protein C8J57DRAFT_433245 [Mycena rebaudengoi]
MHRARIATGTLLARLAALSLAYCAVAPPSRPPLASPAAATFARLPRARPSNRAGPAHPPHRLVPMWITRPRLAACGGLCTAPCCYTMLAAAPDRICYTLAHSPRLLVRSLLSSRGLPHYARHI